MINWLGKLALVMSTIAPVLGAFAVNAISHQAYAAAWWYGGIAAALVFIAGAILSECRRRIEVEAMDVKKVKAVDKESLSFLLVYLLPLLAKESNQFTGDIWTAIYVFGVITLVVAHGNLVMFNPIFALFRIHFYEVETASGMTCNLISKNTIVRQTGTFKVQQIYPFFYMEAK